MEEINSLDDEFKFRGDDMEGKISANRKARFVCTVSDPEKKGEGMSQHICYKINTAFNSLDGKITQSVVIRRFSDFVWLHHQMYLKCKGCLIPPLPDKALIGRFSGEFINERRRGLNVFLDRIGQHPILSVSDDVELFLNGEESALASVINKKDDVKTGLMSFWQSSVKLISDTLVPGKEREKTAEDLACDEINGYATSLETSFTAVHTNAEGLVRKDKDLAKNWFEFGLACTLLGQYESNQSEEVLGDVFTKLGNTADHLSVLLTQKTDQENIDFREPLKDYMRITDSVKQMMKTRQTALDTYQSAVATLESRQGKCDSLAGDKLANAQKSVIEAQELVTASSRELEQITRISLEEANRFKQEKQTDLKRIVTDFVKLQIEHSKKVQGVWESVLVSLQPSRSSQPQL